jgi:hypothetical protein
MSKTSELTPDAETLIAMSPEDVGVVILRHLLSTPRYGSAERFKRGNFLVASATPEREYSPQFLDKIYEALAGGWAWLEPEGVLLPDPDNQDRDWVIVSSRGRQMLDPEKLRAFKYASKFPAAKLPPAISPWDIFALHERRIRHRRICRINSAAASDGNGTVRCRCP